jgi:hypothetical protein
LGGLDGMRDALRAGRVFFVPRQVVSQQLSTRPGPCVCRSGCCPTAVPETEPPSREDAVDEAAASELDGGGGGGGPGGAGMGVATAATTHGPADTGIAGALSTASALSTAGALPGALSTAGELAAVKARVAGPSEGRWPSAHRDLPGVHFRWLRSFAVREDVTLPTPELWALGRAGDAAPLLALLKPDIAAVL